MGSVSDQDLILREGKSEVCECDNSSVSLIKRMMIKTRSRSEWPTESHSKWGRCGLWGIMTIHQAVEKHTRQNSKIQREKNDRLQPCYSTTKGTESRLAAPTDGALALDTLTGPFSLSNLVLVIRPDHDLDDALSGLVPSARNVDERLLGLLERVALGDHLGDAGA